MHKKSIALVLCLSLLLSAGEIQIKNNFFTAELTCKGGALTELKTASGQQLVFPGNASLTERLFTSKNGKSELESFAKLNYTVDSHSFGYQKDTIIQFSAAGIAGHDWLRVIKKYTFPAKQNKILVTYILTNRDKTPHTAGLWIQSFFTCYDEAGTNALLHMPQNGKIVDITHPGNARSDEWGKKPGLAMASVQGKNNSAGILMLPQPELTDGFYAWCGNVSGKPLHTLELLTREMPLAAGQSITFKLELLPVKNVQTAQASFMAKAKIPAQQPGVSTALLSTDSKSLAIAPSSAKTQPALSQYTDVTVLRQFFPTIHAITLPATADASKAAVYPLVNRHADLDRPLPVTVQKKADGTQRLLFQVPGIGGGHGKIYAVVKNGFAYDNYGSPKPLPFLGSVEHSYRIVLNAPTARPQLKSEGNSSLDSNLIFNGSFEKPNATQDFADGFFWQNQVKKGYFSWKKGEGYQSTAGIRVQLTAAKGTAAFTEQFLVRGGQAYTFGGNFKCENPDKKYAIVFLQCYNKDNKPINTSAGKIYAYTKYASADWEHVEKKAVLPQEAVYAQFCAQLSNQGRENILWLDDIFLRPEDFSFAPKNPLENARETAILNGYAPLTQLETIRETYVTPHIPWMKPAAFNMPELLYCCTIVNSNEDAQRRTIVELRQRMSLPFQFIPLLPRSKGGHAHALGVVNFNLDNCLEEYSLERIRTLKTTPKVALIQGMDFGRYDQKGTFARELEKLQAKGCKMLFMNCQKTPANLPGKQLPGAPASWELVPHMNTYRSICSLVTRYEKATLFQYSDANYVRYQYFPSTPAEQKDEIQPAYFSKDFPFWEYPYLPLLKALRDAAGVALPAELKGADIQNQALCIKLQAPAPVKELVLVVEYKTLWRETTDRVDEPCTLQAGVNKISLPLPNGGGDYIAHIFLQNKQGQKWDAAAVKLSLPETHPLKIAFASKKRIYPKEKPIVFQVMAQGTAKGDVLEITVEDTFNRQVFRKKQTASDVNQMTLQLMPPYTTLYRVYATLQRNGKTLSRTHGEFSIGAQPLDPQEQHLGLWGGRLILSGMLRDLGFELLSMDGRSIWNSDTNGHLRNLLNLNYHPLVLNLGHAVKSNGHLYRADIESAPIRTPCFSDSEFHRKIDTEITKALKQNRMDYYGALYYLLGDEMFLGRSVCFSEHCLKNFRKTLEKKYKTISRLNQEWETKYTSFNQVRPVQLKELKNRNNLAPWQEHKLFMANVFAHAFIGKIRSVICREIPQARVGISGTQEPGYSYDWAQLMKEIDCIAYYNGVQGTLINDLHRHDGLFGQWGGGYVGSERAYGAYQVNNTWSNLFKGANTIWNWHGSAYNGDGSPTENLVIYCNEGNLLRQGMTKLLLSACSSTPEVAVVYSQPSLFTCLGSELGMADWQNTQTGWDALLRDLKINFTFISYEDLALSQILTRGFKVIILPMALSISDAEATQLVTFAEKGGLVLADVAPGRYDGAGKRTTNPRLAKLFTPSSEPIKNQPRELKQRILQGRFRIAEPNLPIMQTRTCGKGKAILLNLMMNSYQAMAIGGVGGETATTITGTGIYCDSIRKAIGDILEKNGVRPYMKVTNSKGATLPCQGTYRSAGNNHYFGLLNSTTDYSIAHVDPAKGPKATVTLPVSGVIYDCRNGKKIATGNSFQTLLAPAYGQLYAVLPKEITKVNITLEKTPAKGKLLRIQVSANGAEGPTVYHLDVLAPDGKKQTCYAQNLCFNTSTGFFEFQLPFNAPAGTWTLQVRHVASGVTAILPFTVK